jgi:hypothetical protein
MKASGNELPFVPKIFPFFPFLKKKDGERHSSEEEILKQFRKITQRGDWDNGWHIDCYLFIRHDE